MAKPSARPADGVPVGHVAETHGVSTMNSNLRMEDLSLVLWRERELLETLLYKLEVEKLVLATRSTRWLAAAARDVELVLETVRETELLRAVAADAAAASVGLA